MRLKNSTAIAKTVLTIACAAFWPQTMAYAQGVPVSLRDSFPLGSGESLLCQVQNRSAESANVSLFDQSWAVVCRDSARPVGYVFKLRNEGDDPALRLDARRAAQVDCASSAVSGSDILSGAKQRSCKWREGASPYMVVRSDRGKYSYFVEGFSAYDSALALALRSVVEDRVVDGPISIATTSVGDTTAFARVQALTLDADQALAEGYRRNNSGDYAAASEYFETLQQRFSGDQASKIDPTEFLLNRALQKSNLGQFTEADALFADARTLGSSNLVVQRLQRNYEAINLINQRNYPGAITRLGLPVAAVQASSNALRDNLEITTPISDRINGSDQSANLLGFIDELKLSNEERAIIIDAQGKYLAATAERLNGNTQNARTVLTAALADAVAVREGRVVSIIRLRAQMLSELALVAEDEGDFAEADSLFRSAVGLIAVQYPETRALNAAKAKLAAFLVRRDKKDEAQTIYRDVVQSALKQRDAVSGLANSIAPYFELLVEKIPAQPSLAADFLDASQMMVRPGTAETQAILSRELDGGDTEAARLFRQSLNLGRSIERERIKLAALNAGEQNTSVAAQIADSSTQLANLEGQQQLTLVGLSQYPQYRAVSSNAIALADVQSGLTMGEIFVKMTLVGDDIFIFYTTPDASGAYKATVTARALETRVDTLRDSISKFEDGQYITLPFDIENARKTYVDLFGPIASRLAGARHMVFEPDGAMLRLPPNLLVADDASVAQYIAHADSVDGDPFDFTGVNWLGRNTGVSTAVSARAFFDARRAPVSKASKQYLGMGRNAIVFDDASVGRGVRGGGRNVNSGCDWPLNEWNNPISDAELRTASKLLTQGSSEIVTGEAFADDKIIGRKDLDQYRILHFATHGLVTPPRPECPARPALLTSFGGSQSDGLLTFKEIFDLHIDADMVILSACDTAGRASVDATRDAGVASGGGSALDGLVRSFIGAGGRSVLASHWPAPDDFNATGRLISGLFEAAPGTGTAAALDQTQRLLMDDPLTSHPYYWAGFAIIGDGERPLVRADSLAAAPVAALEQAN